ncbi:MAG: hypothetical protein V4760_11425 [Bdellovibrionota bacterium]
MTHTFRFRLRLLTAALSIAAFVGCGPVFNRDGGESPGATPPSKDGNKDTGETNPKPGSFQNVTIDQTMTLRKFLNPILELVVDIPAGSVVGVPTPYSIVNFDYREKDGTTARSSTGFVSPVVLVSVPAASNWPQSKIDQINLTMGGLFVSARIVGAIEGVSGNFAPLPATTPDAGYLTQYDPDGKPKFNYTTSIVKRFGPRLNKGIPADQMTAGDRERYRRVFAELVTVGNRKAETPKSTLLIDNALATKLSIEYENSRTIAMNGAWSIAVNGTALRHGFENVPCAEFMSEVLRQAYQRAGYRVTDDFSAARGNELIWTRTAAVVTFSKSLYDAGWIPWDNLKFKAPVGAFLMNGAGNSPGHTFLAAGDDGRIIVDNGAPQGRDLRKTAQKTIELMYQTGVFFLPPGIQPEAR